MFSTRRRPSTLAVCACLVHALAWSAAAQERAISVTGNGEVSARPNRLQIELQTSGMAELTQDAIIKYDDALRRVTEAFEKLQLDQLAVEPGDISFASTLVNNARGAQAKPQMAILQSIKLTLSQVDQIPQKELVATVGKLIDTAQDAGATISNNPVGSFNMVNQGGRLIVRNQVAQPLVALWVSDFEPLYDQAYQKAFEDATVRAEKLAKLAHKKLGDVLSIDESSQRVYGPDGSAVQSLASVRLGPIPVRASLRVRFALLSEDQGE
ncbi:MAG TPA: SIMPL domain-containing protein [Pirellulales bacterium]|nr:SIMPL domain-containing protein [Pirellulales bacterium]